MFEVVWVNDSGCVISKVVVNNTQELAELLSDWSKSIYDGDTITFNEIN